MTVLKSVDAGSSNSCSECGKDFYHQDSKCICCDFCEGWFHISCCGLTLEDYWYYSTPSESWACEKCSSLPPYEPSVDISEARWGSIHGQDLVTTFELIHRKVASWKPNVFKVPSGASGKALVSEITRLIDLWLNKTKFEAVAIAALQVFGTLMLQKPSKSSKNRDHIRHLTIRLRKWENGEFGQKFWAPKIRDIDPVSCMGYANVVLLCGINDIKESQIQCENDVANCYAELKQKIKQIKLLSPSTKAVFVCQLLPTKDLILNRKVNDFNKLLHFDLFPSCKDVEYVEGFRNFVCNRVLTAELSMYLDKHGRPDMLHLNRAGARVLAGLIKQSVFLRLNGGIDKRRHTGKVDGRLYNNVVKLGNRLHQSGLADGCQV